MNRRSPVGSIRRVGAAAILAVLLHSGYSLAQAQGGPSAPARDPEQGTAEGGDERLVHGILEVGAHMGWEMGGSATIGVLIGRGVSHLQVAARGLAGITSDSESAFVGGAEVAYRPIWRIRPTVRLTALFGAGYVYRAAFSTRTDAEYHYHIALGRLALGVMLGRGEPFSHGIEAEFDGGYAKHINPRSERWDFTGFYCGGGLSYVFTF